MRLRAAALALLLPLTLLAGCLEDRQDVPADDAGGDLGGQPSVVPFETLAHGQQSGADAPTRRVITDQDAWSAFWAQHASPQMPPDPEPQVDFGEERVVAVVLEEKGDGCWHVEITGVERAEGEIVVEVTTVEPGADVGCPAVMVQPFHFVAIPAGAEPVTYSDRTRVMDPGAGDDPGDGGDPAPGGDPTVRDLDRGQITGAQAMQDVIADQEAWDAFWADHGSRRIPPPEQPAVDFERERVVVVVLSEKPNGCHWVSVESVSRDAEGLRVSVVHETPSSEDICTDVMTNPYHLVAIDDRDAPVRFEEREQAA